MKIKELFSEGILGRIGRGLAQATVPNAYDAYTQSAGASATTSPELAKKLDPKYQAAMDKAQQLAIAKAAKQQKATTGPASATSWDPNKSLLTYKGQQYQKTKTGWKNWYTKDVVTDPALISTIDYQFDVAVGKIKPQAATGTVTLTTNTGIKVWRDKQGRWYRLDNKARVTDPAEVQRLNQLAKNQQLTAKAKGQPVR